jgi:hypothetical protein
MRLGLARHSLAAAIQPRSVSRPTCRWCFFARYSAAKVGPKPRYTSRAAQNLDGFVAFLPSNLPIRRSPARRVNDRFVAPLFQSLPSAPHCACTHPDNLRRLPPADFLRHGAQQHFLHFHHPLHLGARIRSAGFQTLASRAGSPFCKADNSHTNDNK